MGRSPARPDPGPLRLTREHPGAEGPERIAPAERRLQGDSAILPGSIRAKATTTPGELA
jgi:hypothetical protein